MQTRISHQKDCIQLIVSEPLTRVKELQVLAGMTHYEGTDCWNLIDVRLTKYRTPNPYSGSGSADSFCAHVKPETPEESDYVKSLLKDYKALEDGSIIWCSFDGIVKGQERINGYAPSRWMNFNAPGYFSKADALAYLKETQQYWSQIKDLSFDGDDWRLASVNHQLNHSVVQFKLTQFRIEHQKIKKQSMLK